jgi:putative acetyltransferase
LAAGSAVFVLGNPAYYGRFGFRADHPSGFESPYVGPHLMALALGRGEWPANSGKLGYPTPSPRWDGSTRVPDETMPPFLD